MPCPICDTACRLEHLDRGWLLCAQTGFAYRVDADGRVVDLAPTNRSHPRSILAPEKAPRLNAPRPTTAPAPGRRRG